VSVRTATIPAWRVTEGDVSPSGAVVISVIRTVSTGSARIAFSNGTALTVPGERRVAVVVPDRAGRPLLR
jgi:hypothetical protein